MPDAFPVVKIEPLKGSGMVVLPGRLILTLVDLMFGGDGKPIQISPERDFTLIEQRLIRKMTDLPELLQLIAIHREPHRLATWAEELCGLFHRYYN